MYYTDFNKSIFDAQFNLIAWLQSRSDVNQMHNYIYMHKRLDCLALVYENNKYDIAPML